MRILQVTPFFEESYGGTERYSYFLSKALADNGNYVEVYTSYLNIKNSRKIYKTPNLFIHRFYTLKNVWGINPLTFIFPHVFFNIPNFDVIHVHSYLYFLSNQVAFAKIYRSILNMYTPPLILHIHGGLGFPPHTKVSVYRRAIKNIYDLTLGKLTINAANAIIVMSAIEKKRLKEYFKLKENSNIYIIPNAVEDNIIKFAKQREKIKEEKNNERYTLIYVGDLEPWKGIENLIFMMKILMKKRKDIQLKIIGSGSQQLYLKRISTGLPVYFMGYLPHEYVFRELINADVFVFPSLWEGMPTVILEAMALKVPIVSTNVGAIPEVIRNEVDGLLVKPNDVKALASAIFRYLEDVQFAESCAKHAFEKVSKQYLFSKVANRTEKLYHHITNQI